MKLHQNIKHYREVSEMSEHTLARLLGVSTDTVLKWEKGSLRPDDEELHFIACALNVEDDVLTDPGPLPQKSPAKVEVKHDHPAFDGGVLGQPEGIYGTTEENREQDKNQDKKQDNDNDDHKYIRKPENSVNKEKEEIQTREDIKSGKEIDREDHSGGVPPFVRESKEAVSPKVTEREENKCRADSDSGQNDENEMEKVIWTGESAMSSSRSGCVTSKSLPSKIFIIIFAIFFVNIVSSAPVGSMGVIPFGIIIATIIFFIKIKKGLSSAYGKENYKHKYILTNRNITVSTDNGGKLTIPLHTVGGIRIVNETGDGSGSIIINVIGKKEITELPKMGLNPISVFYEVPNVRDVFQKINDAYYDNKKYMQRKN